MFHGEDGDDANANTDLEGLVLDLVGFVSNKFGLLIIIFIYYHVNANTDLEGLVLDLVGNLSWHAVPALLLVMHLKLNDDHDHDRDLDDDDDDENHNLLVHILSKLRLTSFCPWQIW